MFEERRMIEVVPYDFKWKEEFKKIKKMINTYIGDYIIGIEHVGSTSIEGLDAKPVIDVDVVIESKEILPTIIKRLEMEGYVYEGDLGVEGREAFRREHNDGMMKYHLYVCPKEGKGYLDHIAFRDYLRENEDARDEYGRLKKELALNYKYDIDNYSDKKTAFVKEILSKTLYKDEES